MAFGRYHILCMQVQLHTHVAFFAWYCNACHAALQRGSLAWLFLLPATRGLAMAVIKPHGSSFSFDVRCDTLYTHVYFTYFLCLTHTV